MADLPFTRPSCSLLYPARRRPDVVDPPEVSVSDCLPALARDAEGGELLPGVINQIGAENLMSLKRIAEGFAGSMDEKKDEEPG
eukprot:g19833.t1